MTFICFVCLRVCIDSLRLKTIIYKKSKTIHDFRHISVASQSLTVLETSEHLDNPAAYYQKLSQG